MGLNDNDDIQMKSISYNTRNIIFLSRKLRGAVKKENVTNCGKSP